MNTDINNGSCTPNHHGMIDPDETLGMTAHQVRAASIDWSQAPSEATQYTAKYDHYQGRTVAVWINPARESQPAPTFFEMGAAERNMAVTFGESQGAKALLPKVTVRHTLVEAGPGPGEMTVDAAAALIDWSQSPAWATAWAALGRSDGMDAYWIAETLGGEDLQETAPDFGIKLGRGRTIGVNRSYCETVEAK